MTERAALILKFLEAAGWSAAARAPVPGDASTRRYERLTLGNQKAVLMDAPEIDAGGSDYAVIAKLADGNMEAFTAVTNVLMQRGFSAPKILAADLEAGLLLLEHLGDDLYASVIAADPSKERELYEAAVDCLAAIYRSSISADISTYGQTWTIRDYDAAAMQAEVDLMLDWYVPYRGGFISESQTAQWRDIWARVFEYLEGHAPGLVLRDFHAENIFWLPERDATATVGLIDYQDALFGHPAYDLVSLIEDARRDVSPELAEPLKARFCAAAKIPDDEAFQAAYAVMGAQRNAKILGIFVRLAKRDKKPSYLNLLRRVETHFMNDLSHPALSEVKAWLEDVL